MIDPPQTSAEARAHRYRVWGGQPRGVPYNPYKCAYEVSDAEYRSPLSHQCTRKNGYGPDALYCKFHAKRAER